MAIANGNKPRPVYDLLKNNKCTWFIPKISSLHAREKWIVSSVVSEGKIFIDDGAIKALKNGKSLLPAGIIKIEGKFVKGDNILIVDKNGEDCASVRTSTKQWNDMGCNRTLPGLLCEQAPDHAECEPDGTPLVCELHVGFQGGIGCV